MLPQKEFNDRIESLINQLERLQVDMGIVSARTKIRKFYVNIESLYPRISEKSNERSVSYLKNAFNKILHDNGYSNAQIARVSKQDRTSVISRIKKADELINGNYQDFIDIFTIFEQIYKQM